MQVNLPTLLGVDLAHCQRQAAAIVTELGGQAQVLQGELITVSYFDALAAEVNELLQEAGVLPIGEVLFTKHQAVAFRTP